MDCPSASNGFQADHARLLTESYHALLGRPLFDGTAKDLYHAPIVVLSHTTDADPILNYGNLAAQRLWQLSWDELTALPSRQTAEPMEQAQRDAMFAQMRSKGFIENYHGIRIGSTGQRFEIKNAIIWTLHDNSGQKRGEAACFRDVTLL